MSEFEQTESRRIQRLLVRGESEIWIHRGFFYKNMHANEIEAYQQISPLKSQLLNDANIMIPDFYGAVSDQELNELRREYGQVSSNLYKISFLDGIRHGEIDESYGSGLNYSQSDFVSIFRALTSFRNIVRPRNLVLAEDYENSAMNLLENSRVLIDSRQKFNSDRIFSSVQSSSEYLRKVALSPSHRDLNWNNMRLVKVEINSEQVLQITDWGSFGLAYAGYDEGRLLTRLCLNRKLQVEYINAFNNFVDSSVNPEEAKRFRVSFWRATAIRSYREIYLILNGRYDRLIENRFQLGVSNPNDRGLFKSRFILSFEGLIDLAVENLADLLKKH